VYYSFSPCQSAISGVPLYVCLPVCLSVPVSFLEFRQRVRDWGEGQTSQRLCQPICCGCRHGHGHGTGHVLYTPALCFYLGANRRLALDRWNAFVAYTAESRKWFIKYTAASTHVCLSTGWNVILSWFLAPSCRLRTCVSRNFYDFIRRQTVAGWPFHIHTSFGATRLKLKQPHDLAFMSLFGRANCLFDIEHNKFQLN